MKHITFTLCTFIVLVLGSSHLKDPVSRRDLQSTPWALDVEQLSGSCEDADALFHRLWIDASNLCSSTITRMTPPSICAQQDSQPCPPGVENECPDADPFFHKVCVINYGVCARKGNEQFFNAFLGLLGPLGDIGDMFKYAMKGADIGVEVGLMALDKHLQDNYALGVLEAKMSFRKVFHDYPDMLMELVEHKFSQPEQRESMSRDWSKVSQRTQQTILAHACRREADKALRLVTKELVLEDMKAKSTFHGQEVGNQASCFSILVGEDDHLLDNQSLDCLNVAANFVEIFDPTPISSLVGFITDIDWCPDIHDNSDPHFNPRATLSRNHPWHLVKERLAEGLLVDGSNDLRIVENSRGDGESMFHELRRKILSQACPTKYQFAKGVCRPYSASEFSTMQITKAHLHDSRTQLITVEWGKASHDQCCSKEGMTTIRTESDCRKAAKELRPSARYLGKVSDNTIPYGCYVDIRSQDVGFNTNQANSKLSGLYEPICGPGINNYEREFNVLKETNGYVMGALGQACPRDHEIVRATDCEYALRKFAKWASFGNRVADTEKMRGCSLRADESEGFYNDKLRTEFDVRLDYDPPRSDRCEFLQTTERNDVFECNDGTLCKGSTCCNLLNRGNRLRGGRKKCPPNLPIMCANPGDCAGGTDHCCETDCTGHGGPRICTERDAPPAPIYKGNCLVRMVGKHLVGGAPLFVRQGIYADNDNGEGCKRECKLNHNMNSNCDAWEFTSMNNNKFHCRHWEKTASSYWENDASIVAAGECSSKPSPVSCDMTARDAPDADFRSPFVISLYVTTAEDYVQLGSGGTSIFAYKDDSQLTYLALILRDDKWWLRASAPEKGIVFPDYGHPTAFTIDAEKGRKYFHEIEWTGEELIWRVNGTDRMIKETAGISGFGVYRFNNLFQRLCYGLGGDRQGWKGTISDLQLRALDSYVILPSTGKCSQGTELTEEECKNLGDGGVFSNWVDAGTYDLPETCGCYIDQKGERYFNRLTGACNAPDAGEEMICKDPSSSGDFPAIKEGSYPICYAEGVRSKSEMKSRFAWTAPFWFTAGPCPSGYQPDTNTDYKRCAGLQYCAKCYQPYYDCGEDPNLFLVESRTNSMMRFGMGESGYCLDKTKLPAEQCEFWQTTGKDDVLECYDGTLCKGWACCNVGNRGGRKKCPANFPIMCANSYDCADGNDHCCETDCSKNGGPRVCTERDAPIAPIPAADQCEFWQTTKLNDVLECNDGTFCKGWTCCNNRGAGGRKRCPANFPNMCARRDCANGHDYCCEVDCSAHGGLRVCSKRDAVDIAVSIAVAHATGQIMGCTPYSAQQCRMVAARLGLEQGGGGYDFESDYSQKGCYAYSSGDYAGMAFYGSGGSHSEISNPMTNSDSTYRPLGWDCSDDRDPCEFLQTTEQDDVLECDDGTLCKGWSCCNLRNRGGRKKCPLNKPIMCASLGACADGQDYCCESDCSKYGGPRICPRS